MVRSAAEVRWPEVSPRVPAGTGPESLEAARDPVRQGRDGSALDAYRADQPGPR